ncbi:zeta toxin family protein [Adhaeribacter soli]|uniref:Zeta toxin n=1 Tax=Adhaeribacter soli TaxID=2607655 RepID=A0A5N1J1Q0_9BACT|nr:zeta toxin family protein [Adhaeribacter soli]KAA9339997.1 zeta toxin [Adhaeribacter soli]
MEKNLYIIAGCNGAGKTTASFTILPEILNCKEFVNADEIAKGLSPFQPETVSFEAGRIMLHRINKLLDNNVNFAFETTLATKSYKHKVLQAQQQGYTVTLLFFWLQNVDLAIERVRTRVLEGGHNIETHVIKRRYLNGIKNLFEIYIAIADEVMIFDNSEGKPDLIAEKTLATEISILNEIKFSKLKSYNNGEK